MCFLSWLLLFSLASLLLQPIYSFLANLVFCLPGSACVQPREERRSGISHTDPARHATAISSLIVKHGNRVRKPIPIEQASPDRRTLWGTHNFWKVRLHQLQLPRTQRCTVYHWYCHYYFGTGWRCRWSRIFPLGTHVASGTNFHLLRTHGCRQMYALPQTKVSHSDDLSPTSAVQGENCVFSNCCLWIALFQVYVTTPCILIKFFSRLSIWTLTLSNKLINSRGYSTYTFWYW